MTISKHQWTLFRKGRMRIKACACCGELQLPSNSEKMCEHDDVLQSQIVKAGYRLFGGRAAVG